MLFKTIDWRRLIFCSQSLWVQYRNYSFLNVISFCFIFLFILTLASIFNAVKLNQFHYWFVPQQYSQFFFITFHWFCCLVLFSSFTPLIRINYLSGFIASKLNVEHERYRRCETTNKPFILCALIDEMILIKCSRNFSP